MDGEASVSCREGATADGWGGVAEGVAGAFGLEGCGEAEGDDSAGTAESGFGEGVDCSGTEGSVGGMITSERVFSMSERITVCGGGVTTEAIS